MFLSKFAHWWTRHYDNSCSRFFRSNCIWPRATPATTTRAMRCRQLVWVRQPWRSLSRAITTTALAPAVAVLWWQPARVAIRRAARFGTPRASSSASSANISRYHVPCYHADIPVFAPRASASWTGARCAAVRSRATFAYVARSTCHQRRKLILASNVSPATDLPIGSTIGMIGSLISSASPDRSITL